MIHIECPWCAKAASIETDETSCFTVCVSCAIRVELADEPTTEGIAKAA